MGDPTTPQGKQQLERQSPLNSAARIRTPLLIVQGANDPRVNKRESDQIVLALRDRKFAVQYLVAPDEGHGFARPVNTMALFTAAEKFLAEHLGARFQEGGTPEVLARLKEITVDPETVVLPPKVNPAAGAPQVAASLQAGVYKYKATLKTGGASLDMNLVTVIQEAEGAWMVTDTISLPTGEASDTTTLDKKSLTLATRSIKQGAVTVEYAFKENKVQGKMTANGRETPIDVAVGGPLFADGAGSSSAIGALPLVEGYSVTIRNFDIQTQKAKLMQVKVTGVEKVDVPAGSFSCYRVEVTSAEGGPESSTVWIAMDSRKPVKTSSALPQLAGARMVVELQ